MMLKHLALALMLVVPVLAAETAPTSIPDVTLLVTFSPKAGYRVVLRNMSPVTVCYDGYGGEGSSQPIYNVEVPSESGEWKDLKSSIWCGTGTGLCNLRPKRMVSCAAHFDELREGQKLRVTIFCAVGNAALINKNTKPVKLVSNEMVFVGTGNQ